MASAVIENPILNSPFAEPQRHFRFDEDGITNEIIEERRTSSYFVPIAQPKKKGKQLVFDTEWTQERINENAFINQVRQRVRQWREGGHAGVSKMTRQLLDYWADPERDRKLFFCQIEALETAIYIAEVARKYNDAWIENDLHKANESANPLLDRIALKMATGSGKTVVMAMLIAWQTLNKLANSQDARFSDSFLIVTPGITIRDRLRVLLPSDPENYYRVRDLVPPYLMDELGQAKIVITNYHAFQLREKVSAGKLTKQILSQDGPSPFTETPGEMVRRVCREFGNKRGIFFINDEAHHCYRRKPAEDANDEEPLAGEERKEAEKRNAEARVWISGIEAVKQKLGVKAVYDLSATPFFLRGSGYAEGTLFPWVVSDFSLIDAIESGIVKVPRVPVSDDSMTGEEPTWELRRKRQKEIDDCIARHADQELLYDQPYEDAGRLRVTGPFTVESLPPHRRLKVADKKDRAAGKDGLSVRVIGPDQFGNMIIDNLRKAGIQARDRKERLKFDTLEPFAGEWIHARGAYTDAGGTEKTVAVCIGPEHGAVGPDLVKEAAKEAVKGVGFDVLYILGFAFDPHVDEETKRYGKLNVQICRMNPDLSMGDELLKKTGAGNLFMVFGEPDIIIRTTAGEILHGATAKPLAKKGNGAKKSAESNGDELIVEIKGVDIYDPTTGEIRSHSTDDIACWFIDTNYDGESFFVRHAYFTGNQEPYDKLKRALRAEIDEAAWTALYQTSSQPFPRPSTGKIAVKVINHYGDEVLKVYPVG